MIVWVWVHDVKVVDITLLYKCTITKSNYIILRPTHLTHLKIDGAKMINSLPNTNTLRSSTINTPNLIMENFTTLTSCSRVCSMNGEIWLLVTYKPVEFEKYLVEV
jgi:hypothetical protein